MHGLIHDHAYKPNRNSRKKAKPCKVCRAPEGQHGVAGTHVQAEDGDVTALASRVTRIQVEIADLGAEALRVRDQHSARVDALAAECRRLEAVNTFLRADLSRANGKIGRLERRVRR